jgi:hypothetical protein
VRRIRIRRVPSRRTFLFFGSFRYEIDVRPPGAAEATLHRVTRTPVKILTPMLGVGDAWSFRTAADREWAKGNKDWAAEYQG